MRILLFPDGGDGGAEADIQAQPVAVEGRGDFESLRTMELEASEGAGEAFSGGSSGIENVDTSRGESEWQSIRDAAKEQGFDFGQEVADDQTALRVLLQKAQEGRQRDLYADLGRQLAPRADEIQKYLTEASKPASEVPSYQPPPWDDRWASLVDRDPGTGLFVGKPGVPADIVAAVNKRADWEIEYRRDPIAMTQKMVEERAAAIAEQKFREQFQQYQQQEMSRRIIQENTPWLYQQDASGNISYGYDGRPVLSPMGAVYKNHVETLVRAGVSEPATLNQLARQLTAAQFAQQNAQQPAQNRQTRQAKGVVNRNAAQNLPADRRTYDPAATEPPAFEKSGKNKLARMLRQNFDSEAIRNEEIHPEYRDGGADRPTGVGLGL